VPPGTHASRRATISAPQATIRDKVQDSVTNLTEKLSSGYSPVGGGELAFFTCHATAGATLAELVKVAGTRWAVEECFQAAKNETGLDHYQVRRYDAWYRHATLSMLALAFLQVTAAQKARQRLWTTFPDAPAA
jgi:SRSO17 transposase